MSTLWACASRRITWNSLVDFNFALSFGIYFFLDANKEDKFYFDADTDVSMWKQCYKIKWIIGTNKNEDGLTNQRVTS